MNASSECEQMVAEIAKMIHDMFLPTLSMTSPKTGDAIPDIKYTRLLILFASWLVMWNLVVKKPL